MGALTEQEIFDRMTGCLKASIDNAVALASQPRRGMHYDILRKNLRLAGECCRQAAAWREDARWLSFDTQVTRCHKMAGDFLRGYKTENGEKIHYAPVEVKEFFLLMAQGLAKVHNAVVDMKTRATGRAGMILPLVRQDSRTQGRAVGVKLPAGMAQRKSGLIVPAGAAVH